MFSTRAIVFFSHEAFRAVVLGIMLFFFLFFVSQFLRSISTFVRVFPLICDVQGTFTIVSTTGDFKEGDELSVDPNNDFSDEDGKANAIFSYTWQRIQEDGRCHGGDIPNATSEKYNLTQDDVGCNITATVIYEDKWNTNETVLYDKTVVIDNVNDAPTGS